MYQIISKFVYDSTNLIIKLFQIKK